MILIKLQEEPQIASMLTEFRKLMYTISGMYMVRVIYSFVVSLGYLKFQPDILMLIVKLICVHA
jgi:hypothetical protein